MSDPDYTTITTGEGSSSSQGGILATRPEYEARKGVWMFNEDAYDNAGGFISGDHLFKFSREDAAAFQRRKNICWMPNFAKDLADTIKGHLFKQTILRDVSNDADLDAFIKATNFKGNKSMTELMREAFIKAYVYEWSFVLVDKPSATFTSLRDEMEDGRPYAYVLTAKDVVDWQKDEFDQYIWIKIREPFVENADAPLADHEINTRYRIWTREEWILYDSDGDIIEQGVHNLGVVPIVQIRCDVSIKNSDIGTSIFTSIVQVVVRLFNALSELDSLLVNGTFPILVVPGRGGVNQAANENDTSTEKNNPTVGVGSMLEVDPDSRIKPEFINADSSTTEAYYKLIDRLISIMQSLARLDFTGGVKSSGVAMAFEFEKTNQSLLSKAEMLRDAELAILELVNLWMGKEEKTLDVKIDYPNDYNIQDIDREIKNIFETLTLNISDRFKKEFKKASSRKLMPTQSKTVQAEIDKEIEEGSTIPDIEKIVNNKGWSDGGTVLLNDKEED